MSRQHADRDRSRGAEPAACAGVRLCIHCQMDFEWDPQKARANVAKHAIEFADAIGVLEDPYALTMLDLYEDEERWLTLGRDFLDRVIVLSWTWASADTIRPISARRATPKQRRQYAEDAHA